MRRNGEFSPKGNSWIGHKHVIMAFLAVIISILMVSCVHAATVPYNERNAILAIIGEGENQGYTGMLALAGAIRNRGTLKGVYGVKAPRVVKRLYSKATYAMAQKAWAESLKVDITKGADHWENIKAFGKPYWVASMKETYRHKDHVFYKAKDS